MSSAGDTPVATEERYRNTPVDGVQLSAASTTTTLALVVDRVAYGQLLASALNTEAGLHCVAVVASASDVVDLLGDAAPAVVVIEGSRDTLNESTLVQLAAEWPETKLVVLTDMADPASTLPLVRAGAAALLPREAPLDEIVSTIRSVGDGMVLVSCSTLTATRKRLRGEDTASQPYRLAITPRERDVLRSLSDGRAVSAVARSLGITVNTCRGHLKSAMTKLGAHSQLEVVVLAYRAGLLAADQPESTT